MPKKPVISAEGSVIGTESPTKAPMKLKIYSTTKPSAPLIASLKIHLN